jgi:hypothetical protein
LAEGKLLEGRLLKGGLLKGKELLKENCLKGVDRIGWQLARRTWDSASLH